MFLDLLHIKLLLFHVCFDLLEFDRILLDRLHRKLKIITIRYRSLKSLSQLFLIKVVTTWFTIWLSRLLYNFCILLYWLLRFLDCILKFRSTKELQPFKRRLFLVKILLFFVICLLHCLNYIPLSHITLRNLSLLISELGGIRCLSFLLTLFDLEFLFLPRNNSGWLWLKRRLLRLIDIDLTFLKSDWLLIWYLLLLLLGLHLDQGVLLVLVSCCFSSHLVQFLFLQPTSSCFEFFLKFDLKICVL